MGSKPQTDDATVDCHPACVPVAQFYAEATSGPGGGTVALPVGTWCLWGRATAHVSFRWELRRCDDVVAPQPNMWPGFACDGHRRWQRLTDSG